MLIKPQELTTGITFDDVLLKPQKTEVTPRLVNVKSKLTRNIDIQIPLLSSPMDTVTESKLAIALAREGGLGFIHKNMTPREQAEEVAKVKRWRNSFIANPVTLAPDKKIKEVVKIPVVLNGGIMDAYDVIRAFSETDADGVMIARGAINHPWIFKEAKELLQFGEIKTEVTPEIRINTALRHLKYEIEIREEKRAVIPFRKYYTGYLKGLYNASKIRRELMNLTEYNQIEEALINYLDYLNEYSRVENAK